MKSPPRIRIGDLVEAGEPCEFLKPEELESLLEGNISAGRLAEFEAHSERCRRCRPVLEEYRRFHDLLEGEGLSEEEERAYRRTRDRVWAAVESGAGDGAVIPLRRRATRRVLTWAVPVAAALALVALLVPWSGPGMIPGPLEEIPFLPPPDTRGTVPMTVWEQAGSAWRDGDLPAACEILENATRERPESGDLYFYLGYCRLSLGRPEQAVESLETADLLQDAFPSENTRWFLAVAYDRAGLRERCCETLRRIAAMEEKRGGRARELVTTHCPEP
jgi:tetratricopeptide (TPR) repeat protein